MEPSTTTTTTTITNSQPSTSSSPSSSSSREIRLKKRRMIKPQSSSSSSSSYPNSSWKSETTQQQYSTKLITALRHVRLTPVSPSAPRRSRAVKEAADKALALSAKGRTRWSRAILLNKIKLKYLSHKHKRQKVNVTGPNRLPALTGTKMLSLKGKGKGKELPGVERKVKTLGRLVPGCRKETLPVILEEATDYIPALEMQIRAMRELLSRLSAVSASSGGGGGSGDGVQNTSGLSSGSSRTDDEMV